MIALVESLVERINALEARIEVLENQQSKDSKNSSKPSELFGGSFPRKRRAPSADGFAKRTKSLRTKSGRKSGGQKDHPGSTLKWCEEVDEVFVHPVIAHIPHFSFYDKYLDLFTTHLRNKYADESS